MGSIVFTSSKQVYVSLRPLSVIAPSFAICALVLCIDDFMFEGSEARQACCCDDAYKCAISFIERYISCVGLKTMIGSR